MIDDGDLHRRIMLQYGRHAPARLRRASPDRTGAPFGYTWGSVNALPVLLGEEPDGEPLAELWFGAHPAGSASVVIDGGTVGLDAVLEAGLPFMLKLIAAAEPLSIQVHPTAAWARRRHAEEQAAGVAVAEQRYQDPNAKPEIVCALTDFDVLIDFRPVAATTQELAEAGLTSLADCLRQDGLAAAVRMVLTADPAVTEAAIVALVDKGNALATRLAAIYPGDPGVLIAMFLNHLVLRPGEAAFLGAGTVHAYLGGVAVEVMSASDNVLRAGLTAKLVDVDEFLAVAAAGAGCTRRPARGRIRYVSLASAGVRRAPLRRSGRVDGRRARGRGRDGRVRGCRRVCHHARPCGVRAALGRCSSRPRRRRGVRRGGRTARVRSP